MNLKLKVTRLERQITQQQLAQKVGTSRQTTGLIEKGDFNPSLGLYIAIAKALDKTLGDLFIKMITLNDHTIRIVK